jgi:hypothetical protein
MNNPVCATPTLVLYKTAKQDLPQYIKYFSMTQS